MENMQTPQGKAPGPVRQERKALRHQYDMTKAQGFGHIIIGHERKILIIEINRFWIEIEN